jgi:hypothetical protein
MAIRYKVTKDRRSYPGNIHPLDYFKDEIVMAPDGLGIFVYRKRKDAENYLQHSLEYSNYAQEKRLRTFQILKVETIGRGRKLTLCPNVDQLTKGIETDEIFRLSREMGYAPLSHAGRVNMFNEIKVWLCAPGTMVYPGVRILT